MAKCCYCGFGIPDNITPVVVGDGMAHPSCAYHGKSALEVVPEKERQDGINCFECGAFITASEYWKLIPVGERLPDDNLDVLCLSKEIGEVFWVVAGICDRLPNGNVLWSAIDGRPVDVTHWLPLPTITNEFRGE